MIVGACLQCRASRTMFSDHNTYMDPSPVDFRLMLVRLRAQLFQRCLKLRIHPLSDVGVHVPTIHHRRLSSVQYAMQLSIFFLPPSRRMPTTFPHPGSSLPCLASPSRRASRSLTRSFRERAHFSKTSKISPVPFVRSCVAYADITLRHFLARFESHLRLRVLPPIQDVHSPLMRSHVDAYTP